MIWRWAIPLLLVFASLFPGRSSAQSAGAAAELVADSSLLRAVVRALPPQEHDRLAIDPRPLHGDDWFRFPHPSGLVPVDSATLALRREAAIALGATPFSAFVDARCEHGSGGLSRVSDSAAMRRLAEQPRPLCILLSVPVAVGSAESGTDGCGSPLRARTFVYTISPATSRVYEVTADRCGGAWTVSTVQLLSAVYS